jgi:glycosyltransferase involved in cell wall biosynthesis
LKIAFIHYHLKTGGVTTVLRQQVESILDTCDLLVLSGDPPESPFLCDVVHIPGLGYEIPGRNPMDPERIATAIIEAIHLKWNNGCDLVHVHNPTLKKNANFLKILNVLKKRGLKLFLQIHDFAEDGRPLSYFAEEEYIENCHYGVINSRDYNILLKTGLKKEGLHKIFNTITPFHFNAEDAILKNYILYPIRAIRRKNIGEAILLSLFFKKNALLVITLPPNSPADINSYENWKTFVMENKLNVLCEAGLTHKFADLVLSSDFLITTSITEGFGFSFLEPWTANKYLWGRKLPDICQDFEQNSIRLNHLYTRLDVPMDWIDNDMLFYTWKSGIQKVSALFGATIDDIFIKTAYEKATTNDVIDFGLLNEPFQKKIISTVLSSKANRNKLIHLNPFLSNPGSVSNKDELIQNNMDAVLFNYNQSKYREKLIGIYKKVTRDNVCQKIDKKILLSEFLRLNNFSLLKWCDNA